MGLVMLAVWIILLIQGQVREFTTAPIQGIFLLVAEILTAMAMMLGGIGILTRQRWGKALNLTALGMMFYTSVNSIGVFSQIGGYRYRFIPSSREKRLVLEKYCC